MNNLKFIFMLSLVYMSFVGWSSNNWLMIWFIMEIMFMFFIGMVSSEISYSVVELMMKYFVIQVFISLMFSALMILCLFNLSFCFNFGLITILMMKLGMFPFHFWVIMILGKLNWMSFFFMTTFLKVLPVLLVYYLSEFFSFNLILFLSIAAGSVLGLNNTLIQKFMGYSSLIHLCWLIVSLIFSIKIFLIYFFCYLIMSLIIIFVFSFMNSYYINQLKFFWSDSLSYFFVFFIILSFAGFPPFMGFVIKWLVVNSIVFFDMKVLLFFMLFFSFFSVVFYLELFFYLMMLSSISLSWYNYSFSFFKNLIFIVFFFYYFLYLLI